MKKITKPKTSLKTETIRTLSDTDLGNVVGGNPQPVVPGFIMKDSIIIRTGR